MLNWKEIVQNFTHKHSTLIQKTTHPLREHFGLNYFAYHRIDNAGNYTILIDQPVWAEHYVDKQIYLVDPYLRHPSVYQSGICLTQNHGSKKFQEMIVKEGKTVLTATTGLILIQKHTDYVEFFAFADNTKTNILCELSLNQPHILTSFGQYFKTQLKSVLQSMDYAGASLIDLKGKDFFNKKKIHPSLSINHCLA